MRFAIIRKADEETEAGAMPSEELIAAMGAYNEEMVKAGVLRMGEGLKPSSQGARVRFDGGRPTVTDGPFTETKELVAGLSIIDVASREEAIEWVRRWPPIDGGGNVEIEIRPVYELEDFGDSQALEQHARHREQLGR
ncbi:MAG TPA: YciI family protein [Longimicrobium sp.]|nr:YciI family protein [Longimicrobium sp.]